MEPLQFSLIAIFLAVIVVIASTLQEGIKKKKRKKCQCGDCKNNKIWVARFVCPEYSRKQHAKEMSVSN
jgi:hypothetical protein